MRPKAILATVVLLLATLWVVKCWAPEWRDEARVVLRQLFRVLR